LVQNYVTLLAAKGQEDLLLKTVQGFEKSLSLTQSRYASGVVSSADVALAMTQLKSTSAQYQDVVLQRKQLEHALATLMGVVPAQLNLEGIQGNALIKKEQSGSINQPAGQASDFYLLVRLPCQRMWCWMFFNTGQTFKRPRDVWRLPMLNWASPGQLFSRPWFYQLRQVTETPTLPTWSAHPTRLGPFGTQFGPDLSLMADCDKRQKRAPKPNLTMQCSVTGKSY
jgi:hypothetical protein